MIRTLNALAAAVALVSLCALPFVGWPAGIALLVSVALFAWSEIGLELPIEKQNNEPHHYS